MRTRNLLRYVFAVLCAANISGSVEAQTVTWTPGTTYYDYRNSGNENSIKITNPTYNNDNHWEKVEFSGVETIKTNAKTYSTFTGNYDVSDAKVFAKFSTSNKHFYRIVAQDVQATISLPKYTSCSLLFAGNVTLGTVYAKNLYAFEMIDFGTTSTRTKDITWITKDTDSGENNTSVGLFRDRTDPNANKDKNRTILRNGCSGNASFVGENCQLTFGDGKNELPVEENHYYSVMAYVLNYKTQKTQATATFGAKETYFYYSYITFNGNGGTITSGGNPQTIANTNGTDGKVGTTKLNKISVTAPAGYTFKGWNTAADGTGEFYAPEGAFRPSTVETGGEGKGDVTLYAVWEPKTYSVALSPNGGTIPGAEPGRSVTVNAIFGEPMPSKTKSGADVAVPYREGYKFEGYFTEKNGGTMYYDGNMQSIRNWDIVFSESYKYLYAHWAPICTVTLNHNDGSGNKEQVTAAFGEQMPAITIPTRQGYVFNGYWDNNGYSDYYDNGKKYYDSNAASVCLWDKRNNSTLYAHWKVRAYKVIYHSNDSRNIREEKNVTLSNYQVEYSSAQGWIAGFDFKGWSYSPTGSVVLQQNNSISPNNENINEETKELHLYAIWQAKSYNVTLDAQGGSGGTTTVTATYGQSMPAIQIPTRDGYTFNGYWDSSSSKYYNVDGSSARNWDKSDNTNTTLYAHWTPIKYVLTLNGGPNTVIPTTDFGNGTHSYIVSEDRTTITMDVSLEENLGLFHNGVPKKPGFKFVGFYVDDILVASATGDKGRNLEFTNNAYINNSVWKYTGNLTLTAKWVPKYTLSDNVLTFNDGEYLEVGKDWQSGKVNDLLGATEYEVQQGNISSNNPVMAFDIRNVIYQDGSSNKADDLMQSLQNKNYISPNALVYVGPDAYSDVKVNNVIRPSGQEDETKFNNLVVTDRYPIKIIDDFTAQTATYERNKAQSQPNAGSDGMWTQSSGSRWGTLCLPFDIKNMEHGIQFYELRDIHDGTMCFYELPADYVLPANTPVVYKRMSGAGSDISVVVNSEVGIEKNMTYATNDICYNDDKKAPHAKPTIKDWEFRGTLQEVVCCGKDYQNPPANAWVIENKPEKEGDIVPQDIFYFKQDSFTRLGTKTKATCLPYRAYFYRTPDGDSAHSKDFSFSILVMDTDGTTDITSLLDNKEVKANGKIYDLSGRRVMQPVKGRLYIVDGKKKVY